MLLVLGIVLWAAVHLCTSMAPNLRAGLIARMGEKPYMGLFAVLIFGSLALIITGWKAFPPDLLYLPPAGLRHLAMLLMVVAIILFIGSNFPSDVRRYIRHPQLTGVKLWAFAHLLANGETRSVILFGGMLAWGVLEVIFINRRDGAWEKPAPAGLAKTAIHVVIGVVLTGAIVFAHPWLAGVPLIPG